MKLAVLVAILAFCAGLVWSRTVHASTPPDLEDVACASDCDGDAAAVGSTVELTGTGLAGVEKVKFASDGEKRAKAEPVSAEDELVEVVVPEGAVTGPPRVVDSERQKSTSPVDLEISNPAASEPYDYVFPVKGKHTYGDGIGAGRGHQGQDVFAGCGTRLVAAHAGKVELADSHSAAGNYVVIDGKDTDTDHVYMHMAERSPLAEGDRVKTGEAIGHVGETGNASGCHLHFEVWESGYRNGDVSDPKPLLKKWDEYS